MSVESIFSAFGLGDLLARDALAVQLVILAATAGLVVLCLAMMIMAARSAGAARRARSETESYLRNAQDVVVEARQLSAKIERSMAARPGANADRLERPVRVSARETTAEADVEILDLKHNDVVSSRNLDAAKDSATVPESLLRRRR
ncbi:MAG: hypothetical protein HXY21_02140 [Parvularculaceae bacterium]|nr:hypothetical protein [Parvularculaceae bacterium]